MSFVWSFSTSGASLSGRLDCWPIEPGSLTISVDDGAISRTLIDDSNGVLVGDGGGVVDYDYGFVEFDLITPTPASGTEIVAHYVPVEGGCAGDCGKCATHFLRLDITPQAISGSGEFEIANAWSRLFEKLRRDVKPIHVEFLFETFAEYFRVDIGFRFDLISVDEETMDTAGLHTEFDDVSW